MTDNTEYQELLKQTALLKEQLASCTQLVENTPDLLYRTDLEGRITFVSPSVERLSGYTVTEATGMKMAEEVYRYPEERTEFLKQLKQHGKVTNFETALLRKDGTSWYASTNAHWLKNSSGDIIGVEGVTRDVTDLKLAVVSLKQMEERFRLAFQTNPDAININRLSDGLFIDTNDGFTTLTGYHRDDVIGKTSLQINIWKNPEDRQRMVQALSTDGYIKNLEAEFVMKDGATVVALMSAKILTMENEPCILSITRTITDLKAAEAERERLKTELAHSQKMEAIGRLAGGIAHDLNNQLVPIFGYSDILQADYANDNNIQEKVGAILKAADGARELVQQLLAFSRKQTLAYRTIDLNGALNEFNPLLRRTIREDIEIRLSLSPLRCLVHADLGQIKQVVVNLVVNAADAMPNGGTVFIETARHHIATAEASQTLKTAAGDYIMLSIRDTGVGMDDETRHRIFEPFFSTKGAQGTGLGLSTVYGIVRQHEGDIQVISSPQHGTTFRIMLPAATDDALDTTTASNPPKQPKAVPAGREVVCLVEDNASVMELTKEILTRQGYRLLTASNGDRAIELVKHESAIDLLLTDIIMPGMNGTELYTEMSKRFPGLKVLYMSGYSDDIIAQQGALSVNIAFIPKPFTADELAITVREVLDHTG